MVAWWILVFCVAISIIALWKPSHLFGIVSGGAWLLLIYYTRISPFTGVTRGDTFDTIFMLVCFGIAGGLPIYVSSKVRREKIKEELESETPNDRQERRVSSVRNERVARHGYARYAETSEEYQARIHAMLHPKRRR